MIWNQFIKNSLFLQEISSKLVSYLSSHDLIVLIPRVDFLVPQDLLFKANFYFISPTQSPKVILSTTVNKNSQSFGANANKNLFSNGSSEPDTISVEKATLRNIRDDLLEAGLKSLNLSPNLLNFNSRAVSKQIQDRIKDNIPFAIMSSSFGYYPSGYLSEFSTNLTKTLNSVEIKFTFKEMIVSEDIQIKQV